MDSNIIHHFHVMIDMSAEHKWIYSFGFIPSNCNKDVHQTCFCTYVKP